MRKKLMISILVCVLGFSVAAPVFAADPSVIYKMYYHAASESYQGGTFKHSYTQTGPGLNDYRMHYSYYIHPSRGSTAYVRVNGYTNCAVPALPCQWSQVNAHSLKIKDNNLEWYGLNIN